MDDRPKYRAYLLRLWHTQSTDDPRWRASLEDSHTGERRAFATLAQLVQFLEAETGGLPVTHRQSDEGNGNRQPKGG